MQLEQLPTICYLPLNLPENNSNLYSRNQVTVFLTQGIVCDGRWLTRETRESVTYLIFAFAVTAAAGVFVVQDELQEGNGGASPVAHRSEGCDQGGVDVQALLALPRGECATAAVIQIVVTDSCAALSFLFVACVCVHTNSHMHAHSRSRR